MFHSQEFVLYFFCLTKELSNPILIFISVEQDASYKNFVFEKQGAENPQQHS